MTAADPANPDFRTAISAALDQSDAAAAREVARAAWQRAPNASTARFLTGQADRLWPGGLVEHRVAILRSFTVEPVAPLLQAEAVLAGCRLHAWIGEFNAYGQEILDPSSGLYAHRPDTIILALQTRDVAPALWSEFSALSDNDVADAIDVTIQSLAQLVARLRERTTAHIVVHGLEPPINPTGGLLDARRQVTQADAIAGVNRGLRDAFRSMVDVQLLDYGELQARHGRSRFVNERKWATSRLPLSVEALAWLAQEWWRYVSVIALPQAKVLALDLDNTLWGGTIGEDGMSGIKLGDEHPGLYHKNLQRAVLDIARRGVLIVLLSKNNEADALQVLDEHPAMLIRQEHLANFRINWNPKAENLAEMAKELNLGLESFVVLDDSPFERNAIRAALPQVTVPELGEDPSNYADILRSIPGLERFTASAEDLERNRYYAEERDRQALQSTVGSLDEYLASLDIAVQVEPIDPLSLPRAAQLTQKTNQLNLTTRRYTEARLAAVLETAGSAGYVLRARDRFGDNGIVGVAITTEQDDALEIDTLLLSCRVIGRRIEDAMLSVLAARARAAGLTRLCGWYLPTAKNAPARDIYRNAGFECAEAGDGGEFWRLDLSQREIVAPSWIKVGA